MIELLEAAATEVPDHVAVAAASGEVTYGELAAQAEAVAGQLIERGISRFGVLDEDPARVLPVLAGSARVGAEACVYPLNAGDDLVGEHRARFDHVAFFTSRASLLEAGDAMPTASLLRPASSAVSSVDPPADRPVLVMTTGTSGTPKGVRHDWSRLLESTARLRPTPDDRWLLAYGLNQFGGLQILIHVLAARATLVVAEALRPREGLTAMRRFGVTHASGTPTYWRFVLAEAVADGQGLPALHQITLSGEMVPAPLLEDLRAAFPDAKVSQIYAATELGQGISVRDGRAGLPLSFLDRTDGLQLRIVDDELQVRSSAAMLGYYGDAAAAADEWRATGDLVEVVGDRIEFRGRNSDIINVGGVKVPPLAVEEAVARVEDVAHVRVFGRKNAMVGAVVAVEVVARPGADPEAVDDRIRKACASLPPAYRPRSIRFVEEILTTGNKISRREQP